MSRRRKKKDEDILGGIMLAVMVFFCLGGWLLIMFVSDIIEMFQSGEVKFKHIERDQIEGSAAYSEELEFYGEPIQIMTTAYCSCEKCCGWSTGITYSGTQATAGRTVGANLSQFPLGTVLVIDGHEYIVEDTGAGVGKNHVDIYMESHEDALEYGKKFGVCYVKH